MEVITIEADEHGSLCVFTGQTKRSKLTWEAPGLQVYTKYITAKNWGRAANLAMNHAISIHIAPRSLQRR